MRRLRRVPRRRRRVRGGARRRARAEGGPPLHARLRHRTGRVPEDLRARERFFRRFRGSRASVALVVRLLGVDFGGLLEQPPGSGLGRVSRVLSMAGKRGRSRRASRRPRRRRAARLRRAGRGRRRVTRRAGGSSGADQDEPRRKRAGREIGGCARGVSGNLPVCRRGRLRERLRVGGRDRDRRRDAFAVQRDQRRTSQLGA
mmetsp:Transcript_3897/g.16569  ORF Transcript_3897/g.16569 Transcript_3897/m.16569 type:complete len:202 (-) Transcript_3897:2065-2670(-)